ncbi:MULTISPECIES: plastocyanin/azurin family copper-binding protein [Virgibacillus]|uniref:Auracyanin-B n=2 Tax=Virgibacillus TaxID=84406 RepID=A0A024Q6U7_9BACI|nr:MULTISPECIES: plastocyanin/azurin family copper-binding protein [Virgibacillus]EQB38512.1 hypothetical protein M948_07975 [Virgibacillus sp. CM-4]MYL41216.1 hypothetical protein [Virgibacillus massiliensis]GGJ55173.1 hypothetical protein GCM10007111_16810 [Virgibacillus kapii]CDQ37977.1 Auracyanin-B precursor [Virgibacillus massiliensis]
MAIPLYITLIGICILTSIIIWQTFVCRKRITTMTGMMVAMALGMSVGLVTGVMIGILLSGNLFYSTVMAMIIGMVTGYLAGIPVSILAVLDGTLAGVMGGMMGAMLGEMIAPEFQDPMIRIMVVLFIATILLLFQILKQPVTNKRDWLHHPVVMVFGFLLFIMGYNQLEPLIPPPSNEIGHDNPHVNVKNLSIEADEYAFRPNRIQVETGETIKLELNNMGESEHILEFIGLEARELPSSQHHQQISGQIQIHSNAGEKQGITFIPLVPGTYRYICTIPGHKEAGMEGEIEVTL